METIEQCPDYFSARLKWLWNNRLENLINNLQIQEKITIKPLDVFQTFVAADPSENKSAVQWLIHVYSNQGFRWEDIKGGNISKVSETLKLFATYCNRLENVNKNIYTYKTLASLYAIVQPYVLAEQASIDKIIDPVGRELKRFQKKQALDQTYTLYDNNCVKMVIPLSQQAAQWWGQGTQWCTAAENNNMFDDYNKQAPLMILLFKDNLHNYRKLQLWINQYNFQWMDETDGQVSEEFIKQNWSKLEVAVAYCVMIKNYLINIPTLFSNESLCNLIVEKNGLNLQYVVESSRTKELSQIACEQTGLALQFVPEIFRKRKLCMIAIKQTGLALKHVPENLQTNDLFRLAVQQNGLALNFIPEHLRTEELCWTACKQTSNALQYVPYRFRSLNLCELSIKQNTIRQKNVHNIAFAWVPNKYKTKKLCQLAVEYNGLALEYVPDKLKTPELSLIACKKTGLAFMYVPKNHINAELCQIACENSIPESEQTDPKESICNGGSGYNLKFIPDHYRTYELCLSACESFAYALCSVPPEFKDFEMCRTACEQNLSVINNVPQHIQTQSDFMSLVKEYKIQQKKFEQKGNLNTVVSQIDQVINIIHQKNFNTKENSTLSR